FRATLAAATGGGTAANSWVGVGAATGFLRFSRKTVAPVPPLGALSFGSPKAEARPLVNPYSAECKRIGVVLSTSRAGKRRIRCRSGFPPGAVVRGSRPVCPPLALGLEQEHSGRRGHVERADSPPGGDRDQEVAGCRHPAAKPPP